jgi:hypothetical protein
LPTEDKAQQNAKGERFHIAVSLCIICAMKIKIGTRSAIGAPMGRERRERFRDNTCGKMESNSTPQYVYSANGAKNSSRHSLVHTFYTTKPATTFDFGFSQ